MSWRIQLEIIRVPMSRLGSGDPPPLTAPVITDPGTITGTPEVGQTLSVTGFAATGNPAPDLSYQWQRNGAAISGATGATYALVEADAGADVRRQTTATNSEGSASAVTPAVAVAGGDPAIPQNALITSDGEVFTTSDGQTFLVAA